MAVKASASVQASRQKTEARLVAAVGAIVAKHGFTALGVNTVARKARVPKPLIYRYFGGLPGLVKAYAHSRSFWPTAQDVLAGLPHALEQMHPADACAEAMCNYARALMARPETLQLLAWECVERTELTAVLEEVREKMSLEVFAALGALGLKVDQRVMHAANLFAAAAHYLCMRRRFIGTFGGMNLKEGEDLEALRATVAATMRQLLENNAAHKGA